MDIRFAAHEAFHRAAAGSVGTAVIAGVALSSVTPVAPVAGGIAGLGAGAALGYGQPLLRLGAAGAAIAVLLATSATWPVLAVGAGLLALGLAIGGTNAVRGAKGALVAMAGVGIVMLGMWCAVRIDTANETASWSAMVRDAVSAGAFGLVGIVAMLPRHLTLELDPVSAMARQMPSSLDPEVRELVTRALSIWQSSKDRLASDDPGKTLVRDGVLKTLEVAMKSADVRVTGASDGELATRMADLDSRIAATTDAETKRQYQQARAALDDQRRYREHIAQGRERTVARMHNHVAALEKFQLAATGLTAARAATAGSTAMKQLEELSQDVAASGEALAEIELDDAAKTAVSADATATSEAPTASN